MLAKAAAGGVVDRGGDRVELAYMQAWGKERAVRAAVLRNLLIEAKWPVDVKGVQLRGVRISGHLDLKAATLRCPLSLDGCFLDTEEPACLDHANASLVALTGCQLAGLTGDGLTVAGLDVRRSTFAGVVWLVGADIAGQLNCQGAELNGRDNDGYALVVYGMRVGGDARLDGVVTTAGAIRVVGADITGQLNCQGAELNGHDNNGYALVADRVKAGGDVWLDEAFTSAGGVSFRAARIGGSLALRGDLAVGEDEMALDAPGMQITGTLQWEPIAQIRGRVNLEGAAVGELEDTWKPKQRSATGYWPIGGRLSLKGFTYDRIGPAKVC
jgi:hypothetical protein